MRARKKLFYMISVLAIAAFVLPTTANLAYPDKVKDCSGCHGPSSGTYYDSVMTISVSKTTLSPGESYTVGIDIVIQTQLTKHDTGYAIQELAGGTWIAIGGPADQSHYSQAMTAPSTSGSYSYRVWGESGPATSDGMADYDDYTITVQAPANIPPVASFTFTISGLAVSFNAGASTDSDGTIVSYAWKFGDTTTGTGATATHTFSSGGTYSVNLTVTDNGGATGSAVKSVTVTSAITFDLNLVAGWNFVSVPLVGTSYKASTLGLATGDVVASWNPPTQTFDKTYNVGISPPLLDFAIANSTGYWIYSTTAKVLHLTGTIPTTPMSRSITVPSGGGWVAIGFNSLNASRHAIDVPPMYSVPGGVTVVASYNPGTMTYTPYYPGMPVNNFLLAPGAGYWIWCTTSGSLTYNP